MLSIKMSVMVALFFFTRYEVQVLSEVLNKVEFLDENWSARNKNDL